MKNQSVMMLLLALSGCTFTSPIDNYSKDKADCERISHGSSPYANTTGGTARDQFAACMKDRGWPNE
jgi:hypothetical protein